MVEAQTIVPFFKSVFGFPPHPFQEQVATHLLNGRNVILQAPTGAGKTIAAQAPFLLASHLDVPFPSKMLYAVPMRTLANQFFDKMNEIGKLPPGEVRIQTGERQEDRRLEGRAVFSTIDQVLSSFLMMPYSLPRRGANLNAGAIVSSYLIFDELHLYETQATMPTTLEMIHMLRGAAPFVLMTATFSSSMLDRLAGWLDADVVPADDYARRAMMDLPAERTKERFYHLATSPLNADAVLDAHRSRHRSLVVCNVVRRAQELFRDLLRHPLREDTQILLLHSRFLPGDRKEKERQIIELFGKNTDRTKGSVIAIATQVVEVGLDISSDVLHTELAPANAILQRAGRCARFAHEVGHVHVYPVESELPYADQKDVMDLTADFLSSRQGMRLDFLGEQELVDFAHGKADRALIDGLIGSRSLHRQRMNFAFQGRGQEGGALIREIASQPMTISSHPEALLPDPFAFPRFSLHPGSLRGLAKKWLEVEHVPPLPWRIMRLIEAEDAGEESATRYAWQPINRVSEVGGAPLLLVHPALAGYNTDEGLLEDRGSPFSVEQLPSEVSETRARVNLIIRYRKEDTLTHVRLVLRAMEKLWPEMAGAAARLERRAGWPTGSIQRAAQLAAVLHDAGKLTMHSSNGPGWQRWAGKWQQAIGQPLSAGEMVAHTDYDSTNPSHLTLERKLGRRPPHAAEGALAVAPHLAQVMPQQIDLARACLTAIARHHGPFTDSFNSFQLMAGSGRLIADWLRLINPSLPTSEEVELLTQASTSDTYLRDILIDVQDNHELLAYMLFVRLLRFADQAGTAAGAPL